MSARADLHDLLSEAEAKLGLNEGFALVQAPWALLDSAEAVFLSLSPGAPAPGETEIRRVSDERGNSFRMERDAHTPPLTEQFLAMAELLDRHPDDILTGVLMPFRNAGWADLNARQREMGAEIGRAFWASALTHPARRIIVTTGGEVEEAVSDMLDASPERRIPAGWGDLELARYATPSGATLIALPNLSLFGLFSRPESERPLRQIFRGI